MAVTDMLLLGLTAPKKNRKAILETIQHLGVMEVTTAHLDDPELAKMDTKGQAATFDKRADVLSEAASSISKAAPEKIPFLASLGGKKQITKKEFQAVVDRKDSLDAAANEIARLERGISDCRASALAARAQEEALAPWLSLPVPMDFSGTKATRAFIGTVSGSATREEVLAPIIAEGIEAADAEIIFSENDRTGVFVLCRTADAAAVEEALKKQGFSKPQQAPSEKPADAAARLEGEIAAYAEEAESLKGKIAAKKDLKNDLRVLSDYYRTRAEKYRFLGTIPQSEKCFFFKGWVPADKAERLRSLLENEYGAVTEIEEPAEDEPQPTLLKNNAFSASVESVLASYGLPQKGKIDPTFVMSIFYVFFFGMMLSDAGYGILMSLACGILVLKFPRMETGMSRFLQLFFWCGLSTTFWGFMYGGFFGDAIQVIAETFFGYTGGTILKPLWFEPVKNPMLLLVWCMLFGVIHLFAGLGMKGAQALKDRDFVGFFADVVAWYLLLTGLILMLLPSDLFASIAGMSFTFPAWLNTAAKLMAIIGAAVILVMSGRSNKNFIVRIALGAYDLYGITGWLSDVLSYSRLLALGLATGVIASVINMMAKMVAGGILGPLLFALVFIIGHALNIGINALGAYVHTNRLQFVEFFGKFYEGGGKAFAPFKTANTYIEIKEEKQL